MVKCSKTHRPRIFFEILVNSKVIFSTMKTYFGVRFSPVTWFMLLVSRKIVKSTRESLSVTLNKKIPIFRLIPDIRTPNLADPLYTGSYIPLRVLHRETVSHDGISFPARGFAVPMRLYGTTNYCARTDTHTSCADTSVAYYVRPDPELKVRLWRDYTCCPLAVFKFWFWKYLRIVAAILWSSFKTRQNV